ncbi:MAG TPA: hypothetical protein VFZ23_02760 [Pyrinomonadaceae bacterium]
MLIYFVSAAMEKVLLIFVIILLPTMVRAQNDVRSEQAERVRRVVESFGQRPTKVTLLSRSLIVAKGKIIRSRDGSFDLRINRRVTTVPYGAVLEMQGGGQSISFVPKSQTRNYGDWRDVGHIYAATRILILTVDGSSIKGFSNSITDRLLIMIDEKGRERVEVPVDKILAVYGLIGGYGGVKAGASKGEEAMHAGRDKLLGGVFTGIGALIGLAKSDGRPILIYSR